MFANKHTLNTNFGCLFTLGMVTMSMTMVIFPLMTLPTEAGNAGSFAPVKLVKTPVFTSDIGTLNEIVSGVSTGAPPTYGVCSIT